MQALDEFQKMRPTEIPRELEEYLCWVAKTGDPVYQWSLIKTLFREKLTRVMTEFYESCPTLELAPCPNVNHFNYDNMKTTLLDRLESFANAPFTVQRICELLTAPRKEYNRVDKFMRAIEKNILVVSTREPGPIARRSENGDNMVNGSVDEDAPATQPTQDVEMEYWEKDCPSTVTISVHTVENETPQLHNVVPALVKNVFTPEESTREKVESTSSKPETEFLENNSEFSPVANLSSQGPETSTTEPMHQNFSTVAPEPSGIDVPEAIMNEDTSSQPSLDLENEENDSADSSRKLQTTFQSKDFASNESKSQKFSFDNPKVNEQAEPESRLLQKEEDTVKPDDPLDSESENLKTSLDKLNSDSETENLETSVEASKKDQEPIALKNIGTCDAPLISRLDDSAFDCCPMEKNEVASSEGCQTTNLTLDAAPRIETSSEERKEGESEDTSLEAANVSDKSRETEFVVKNSTPVTEESSTEEKNPLIVTEDDEQARVIESILPDPISMVEEPTDVKNLEDTPKIQEISPIVETSEDPQSQSSTTTEEKLRSVETNSLTELQANNTASSIESSATENSGSNDKTESESAVLMEVETVSIFQDSEPMEQETTELSKSQQ